MVTATTKYSPTKINPMYLQPPTILFISDNTAKIKKLRLNYIYYKDKKNYVLFDLNRGHRIVFG